MTDHFVQASFAFTCTAAEAALIEEAWSHAADLMGDFPPGEPSAEFLAAFPPTELGNPFTGLTAIFFDPAFPDFGAELSVEGAATCNVSIHSLTDFQPDPVAELIRRCCPQSLAQAPVGFDWNYSCSKARRDCFGGGWCIVFADKVVQGTTRQAIIDIVTAVADAPGDPSDAWVEDAHHRVVDWQQDVASDHTRLGYRDWVAARHEEAGADRDNEADPADTPPPVKPAIRIRATDNLGTVAWVHREQGGSFRCTLANGTPASFFYAGISEHEMACRFALDDCQTAADALALLRQWGCGIHRYDLAGPSPATHPNDQPPHPVA